MGESYIIGVDYTGGRDETTLVVFRNSLGDFGEKVLTMVNTFSGKEAEHVYEILTGKSIES